ncbi:hypothetical protein CFAM422_008465 [Trichoderma lentiforme]|uniref:Uncharacterized protein n=1 Tax=Trichoderma lentiforme TaxID=1567552 RepID=A0A9P4XCI9_9HYPO|nr:hypothetical protein CFAM422_008465 [Trichoderma lentiforme]
MAKCGIVFPRRAKQDASDSCLSSSLRLSRNIQILREPQIQPQAAPSLARMHGTWHEVSRCSGEQERNQQTGRQADKTNIDTT